MIDAKGLPVAAGLALFGTVFCPAVVPAQESDPGWIESFDRIVGDSMGDAREYAEVRWQQFEEHMGYDKPRHIAAYSGYGNGEHVWIQGRVLHNEPYGGPQDDDGWWDNLRATYQRWESDEVADAPITLTYVDQQKEVVTDEEGYYSARFDIDPLFPNANEVLARYDVEGTVLNATHRVYLKHPEADFMLISDVDDTIIHTGLTSLLTAARLTFLHNAKTRKPLLGAGALYRELAGGKPSSPVNPVIYVSNSAWNMYDLLRDFLALNDLPRGPLLLRDIGLEADTEDHKVETIRRLMERFPSLPAVLIGDSGQHDAEIYARIAAEYPDRVHSIFIRDVDPRDSSEDDSKVDRIIAGHDHLDVRFTRIADSRSIAESLADAGLLPESALDAVAQSVAADQGRKSIAGEAVSP